MSNEVDEVGVELAKYNLTLVIEWIKFADSKATFLLTIALAVVGLSLTEIPPATRVVTSLVESDHWWLGLGLIVLHFGFYAFSVYTIFALVKVVRPSLAPKPERHSWFFFQSLALLSPEDFKSFSAALDTPNKLSQLTDQIYNNAVVARQKYAQISHALTLLLWSVLLGLLAVAPVLVLDALWATAP